MDGGQDILNLFPDLSDYIVDPNLLNDCFSDPNFSLGSSSVDANFSEIDNKIDSVLGSTGIASVEDAVNMNPQQSQELAENILFTKLRRKSSSYNSNALTNNTYKAVHTVEAKIIRYPMALKIGMESPDIVLMSLLFLLGVVFIRLRNRLSIYLGIILLLGFAGLAIYCALK